MFCKKCGAQLDNSVTICPNCGEMLYSQEGFQPLTAKKKPIYKKPLLYIIIAAVVVVAVGVTCAVLFLNKPATVDKAFQNSFSVAYSENDLINVFDADKLENGMEANLEVTLDKALLGTEADARITAKGTYSEENLDMSLLLGTAEKDIFSGLLNFSKDKALSLSSNILDNKYYGVKLDDNFYENLKKSYFGKMTKLDFEDEDLKQNIEMFIKSINTDRSDLNKSWSQFLEKTIKHFDEQKKVSSDTLKYGGTSINASKSTWEFTEDDLIYIIDSFADEIKNETPLGKYLTLTSAGEIDKVIADTKASVASTSEEATVNAYVSGKYLYKLEVEADEGTFTIDFGKNPEKGDVQKITIDTDDTKAEFVRTVETDDNSYKVEYELTLTENSQSQSIGLTYDYDKADSHLTLSFDADGINIKLGGELVIDNGFEFTLDTLDIPMTQVDLSKISVKFSLKQDVKSTEPAPAYTDILSLDEAAFSETSKQISENLTTLEQEAISLFGEQIGSEIAYGLDASLGKNNPMLQQTQEALQPSEKADIGNYYYYGKESGLSLDLIGNAYEEMKAYINFDLLTLIESSESAETQTYQYSSLPVYLTVYSTDPMYYVLYIQDDNARDVYFWFTSTDNGATLTPYRCEIPLYTSATSTESNQSAIYDQTGSFSEIFTTN